MNLEANDPQGQIEHAAAVLRAGGLVAFPTETVYGLGADARNREAVLRIFAAKGRPATNPLIVHVANEEIARRFAGSWPSLAEQLARAFWPGPLTLIVPRGPAIVNEVAAGGNTVGFRAPDHPLALQLLRAVDAPIAAPSANPSNRISPTTADHVRRELGSSVDLVLDGGPCRVGIESTVLDLSGDSPIILRPGAVTREQIEAQIGPVGAFEGSVARNVAAQSPGQQPIHYSPAAPAYRFTAAETSRLVQRYAAMPQARGVFLLLENSATDRALQTALGERHRILRMPADCEGYARQLYAALHEADAQQPDAIWIELPPVEPRWAAVRDRLVRATRDGAAVL